MPIPKRLFNENILWRGSADFDVLVGRFHEVKVCELVETFILNKLKNISQNTTFGLDKGETIAIINGFSGLKI